MASVDGPINDLQMATLQRMFEDYEAWSGIALRRDEPRTIHEHNENPAASTACPAGRYDRFYELWEEGSGMPSNAELKAQLDAQNEAITQRDDLRLVAAGPYKEMQDAWTLLKANGLIPERPS